MDRNNQFQIQFRDNENHSSQKIQSSTSIASVTLTKIETWVIRILLCFLTFPSAVVLEGESKWNFELMLYRKRPRTFDACEFVCMLGAMSCSNCSLCLYFRCLTLCWSRPFHCRWFRLTSLCFVSFFQVYRVRTFFAKQCFEIGFVPGFLQKYLNCFYFLLLLGDSEKGIGRSGKLLHFKGCVFHRGETNSCFFSEVEWLVVSAMILILNLSVRLSI